MALTQKQIQEENAMIEHIANHALNEDPNSNAPIPKIGKNVDMGRVLNLSLIHI